ncbi:DcuS/MalK family sensor histidine kinase [Tolumonas osonensis]|uniref:histidine kinase n=1 Tax=Tolumonas osonensis TaxID=675874 RepID=A0A841GJF2_9GAMM|nr:two-component system sensor histidine kinase DcuS [Tolumonas osonensis]
MLKQRSPLKLRSTITLLVCSVIALVLFVVHSVYVTQSTELSRLSLEDKAKAVLHTLTVSPFVAQALSSDDGNKTDLQDYIEQVRQQNELLFIVVMDMQGIRHTHPDPSLIGKHFIGGDEVKALHGQESVSEAKGTLGPSLRIISPLFDVRHQQIGAIAVGISTEKVQEIIAANRWFTYWAIAFGGLIGSFGAFFLARKIKKIMFGMEPSEIASLLEERNAMLQSIREGIIAVNAKEQITLINDEAKRLLRQNGDLENLLQTEGSKHWPALLHLRQVLASGHARRDEEIELNGSTLLTNSVPVRVNGQVTGAIVTFRDKTEVSQLIQRLSGISHYAEALRVQAHEFMNKLHVILGMVNIRAYDQLENYIMDTANYYHEEVGSLIRQIKDPVIAGFILGKMNRGRELGVEISVTPTSYLPESARVEVTHELVTILGNLMENAMEALDGYDSAAIVLTFDHDEDRLRCSVSDNGKGIEPAVAAHIFEHGFSTKGTRRGIGLYLVRQSLEKLGGTIECQSKPGEGTRFIISLPYASKEFSL